MRIIFRADASRSMGSGHVMRSSVLAEEAISRGHECIFVGKISDLDWVKNRMTNLGFTEMVETESNFQSNGDTDILVLDSYTIPTKSKFIYLTNWKYTLSISDEMTPNYFVNAKLIPSLELPQRENTSNEILFGTKYILLRAGISKSSRTESVNGNLRVLIVGGGSDPFGFVRAITKYIGNKIPNLEMHCFINNELSDSGIANLVTHEIGPDLDIWANEVDVVLTTASTTSLEFIAREVPTGVVCAVDNQQEYYEQLGRLGYASQVGFLDSSGEWIFNFEALRLLLTDVSKRDSLRNSIRGLIDLNGASRVIDFLEEHSY